MSGPERSGTATSVRALLANGADDRAVVAEMARGMPPGGIPTTEVRRRPLLEGAQRLLDGQVLAAAARCLDQDVAGPIATWLTRFQELQAAAAETLRDSASERTVVLDIRRRLESTQAVEVRMYAGKDLLGTFPFGLVLTAELGRTAVVVRGGAVHQVDCVAASMKASITFADVPKPLWERSAPDLALRLPLARPLRIPLVPVPRSSASERDRPLAAT